MCWPDFLELLSRGSSEPAPTLLFGSSGALWDRAALELQCSWRNIAQAPPLRGEAGGAEPAQAKAGLAPEGLRFFQEAAGM
ncbi:hypothetical protein NDU88_003479 [Pleurodeles waltl]|uniref:Uncharacterized protein n=1 Tax=Pleurodeles waltl TaxID=8319 RepID=A0AAV7LFF9_PLEWA|nr:hypothetical protein NDU88_003479 [Pleurodeles waltl]